MYHVGAIVHKSLSTRDFEPVNDTSQNTPKQVKMNKTSPTKAHGDSPKKATPKRRADKENTEVA